MQLRVKKKKSTKKQEKMVLVIWEHYHAQTVFLLIPWGLAKYHTRTFGDAAGLYITEKHVPDAVHDLRKVVATYEDTCRCTAEYLTEKDHNIVRVCHSGQLS